jgi:glucosylceramidase
MIAASLALALLASIGAGAQSVSVYQTTPDLLEALSQRATLHFSEGPASDAPAAVIVVDDSQRFQQIDGFGASLTDAAAWLFAKKLTPAQTDAAFKMLFTRKEGIALSFLRQPIGSSDLAATFYSYDDLCVQTTTPCTTPAGVNDYNLEHYSIKHDEEYILPQLRKALALNPDLKVILTPWSPPGWMKTSGSMLGSNPDTKESSSLRTEAYTAFANYLVKTIQGYQTAGVPIYGITVENEPLYDPPTYSLRAGANRRALEPQSDGL